MKLCLICTHSHLQYIISIKGILKFLNQCEYWSDKLILKIVLFLANLRVYKRKLLQMPHATKLAIYDLPENRDTFADFT
jgi:hypothetical protein